MEILYLLGTNHLRLLSTWNEMDMTKEMNFYLSF